jgi:hypothetical protein
MSRLSTIARRARYRKPPPQIQELPAIPAYRDRLDHLADAGGAYLVLPYGLLEQLSAEQQQQIVHIVKEVARTNPQWASDTTYQVLPWARVHPADLSAEELTWHGIGSDIDPTTGTVATAAAGGRSHQKPPWGTVQDSTQLQHHQEHTQEPDRRCSPPHPARI